MKRFLPVFAVLFSAVFVFCLTAEAFAKENRTGGVNKRQRSQAQRIKQGVKSGELTGAEAKGLIREEKQIQKMKKEAKADGVVTAEEKKVIHEKLNEQSKEIYQEKHDSESK